MKDNSPPEFRFQTKAAIYYRKLVFYFLKANQNELIFFFSD